MHATLICCKQKKYYFMSFETISEQQFIKNTAALKSLTDILNCYCLSQFVKTGTHKQKSVMEKNKAITFLKRSTLAQVQFVFKKFTWGSWRWGGGSYYACFQLHIVIPALQNLQFKILLIHLMLGLYAAPGNQAILSSISRWVRLQTQSQTCV